jgi:hypothetical protein
VLKDFQLGVTKIEIKNHRFLWFFVISRK